MSQPLQTQSLNLPSTLANSGNTGSTSTNPNTEPSAPLCTDLDNDGLTFAQHYSFLGTDMRDVLCEIVEDTKLHKNIHNCDDRFITPFKLLRSACARYLRTNQGCRQQNFLVAHSIATEVLADNVAKKVFPASLQSENVERHLSFMAVSIFLPNGRFIPH